MPNDGQVQCTIFPQCLEFSYIFKASTREQKVRF
jgi:hypothetical protein